MLTVKRWSIQPGFPAGPGIANTKQVMSIYLTCSQQWVGVTIMKSICHTLFTTLTFPFSHICILSLAGWFKAVCQNLAVFKSLMNRLPIPSGFWELCGVIFSRHATQKGENRLYSMSAIAHLKAGHVLEVRFFDNWHPKLTDSGCTSCKMPILFFVHSYKVIYDFVGEMHLLAEHDTIDTNVHIIGHQSLSEERLSAGSHCCQGCNKEAITYAALLNIWEFTTIMPQMLSPSVNTSTQRNQQLSVRNQNPTYTYIYIYSKIDTRSRTLLTKTDL